MPDSPYNIAIAGGGPMCTYAMERLAALLSQNTLPVAVNIFIFERSGRFGAGEVHSDLQPSTSYMNRIAGQIALGLDGSSSVSSQLLPRELRLTFLEWCRKQHEATGDGQFNLSHRDVPARKLHGLALRQMFDCYVEQLGHVKNITITLFNKEITDVSPAGGNRYNIICGDEICAQADHVLFVTGHMKQVLPANILHAYPLEQLNEEIVPAGSTVGVQGLGLTAIDVFLHLTEGRGGKFIEKNNALQYIPSGREPGKIIGFSPSGLLITARPVNVKENAQLEHKAVFFTLDAITTLRQNFGVPAQLSHGKVLQLDFEVHLFPLLVLEMAWVYYKTKSGTDIREKVQERYVNFLSNQFPSCHAGIAYLLEPLPDFDWKRIHEPLHDVTANWQQALIALVKQDIANATENNLKNAVKAACDGVYRDLRTELCEAADNGGLLPHSHRQFINTYMRYYNRLSNGAALEAIKKVLALLEHGVLDVSTGPCPAVKYERDQVIIQGTKTGVAHKADLLVDGKVHSFDPENDARPLYPNLLQRGLIRKWRNHDFYPGGLDLTAGFHPINNAGQVNEAFTFLGVPLEGVRFFQPSAARPNANSYVLNNVASWANEQLLRIQSATPSITGVRQRIAELISKEIETGRKRNIVIFGLDGLPYYLTTGRWRQCTTEKMRSVFPTTSSTGWLSSLSGLEVDAHGIPGVVFRVNGQDELINAFKYKGELGRPSLQNIFSDACAYGYTPIAITGDFEIFDCEWRNMLLCHSEKVNGYHFYSTLNGAGPANPAAMCEKIQDAVVQTLQLHAAAAPCIIWCCVDIDQYIHLHGYDDHVTGFISEFEELALRLTAMDLLVVAHSDHGLTATVHDPQLEQVIEQTLATYGGRMGGAGRTRWIYAPPEKEKELMQALSLALPSSVRLCQSHELFEKNSLSGKRVGNIVLIAEGEEFLTAPGYIFDHGSLTQEELFVPFSVWNL